MSRREPLRVGVLLSGSGTSLENLFECIDRDGIRARISVVIASKEDAGGLARAERHGVPALAVPRRRHRDVDEFNDRIHAELAAHDVEFVALLGFLSPFQLRGKFEGRAINVHPALIPAFSGQGMYGHHVYDAVLEKGVKVTGATVHFVDEEYDQGPIILQRAVPVEEDDTLETLSARVQAAERELVPEAIRLFAEGRLTIAGGRVHIDR
jgi:formyltetrahydrofolate-dependent phosphoribosylglycinamide formyltransferase